MFFRRRWRSCFHPGRLWGDRHREVVLFVSRVDEGLQTTCTVHIWDEGWGCSLYEMRTSGHRSIDANHLFRSALHVESSVRLVDDPLHNKYINHYNHYLRGDTDTTPVYFPSRLYHFWSHGTREVVLENHLDPGRRNTSLRHIHRPGSALWSSSERLIVIDLQSDMGHINLYSDLQMEDVTCNSLEAPRLTQTIVSESPWAVSSQKISSQRFFSVSWLNVTAEKLYSICELWQDESRTIRVTSWWATGGSSGSSRGGFSSEEAGAEAVADRTREQRGGFSSEEAVADAERIQVQQPTEQFVWRVCGEMAKPM